MSRLTKKINNYYDSANDKWHKMRNGKIDLNYVFELEQKLGQLEDIEEELGIDLPTLFKALKEDNFYSKHPETGEISWIALPELYYCSRKWNIGCGSMIFNEQEKCCDSWDCDPKDYGKTWALDKKDLLDKQKEGN